MSEQIGFNIQSVTIQPGAEMSFHGVYDYFRVMSLTAGATLKVSLDGGSFSPFLEANWYRAPAGDPFEYVTLKNAGAGALTVQIGLAMGSLGYDALAVSGAFSVDDGGGSLTVDDGGGSLTVDGSFDLAPACASWASTVGIAASIIAGVSPTRKSVCVQNLGSAPIFIGGSGALTVANGYRVSAGGELVIDKSKGEVWAISTIAGQDIRVLSEG